MIGLLPTGFTGDMLTTAVLMVLTLVAAGFGYYPAVELLGQRRDMFDRVLRRSLLIDISPTAAVIIWLVASVLLGVVAGLLVWSLLGFFIGLTVGLVLPRPVLGLLRRKRIAKLENQLVGAIQQLSAGVRAGLNLIQSMGMIARDGPRPVRQEFRHLLREYEFGVPLDQAMSNAADRIGSSDYRLLFAALHTHRERGGNLGETLDQIAASIREIQRLEKRVQTLTAQGRTTARWLGAMPVAVLGVLFLIQRSYVFSLFETGLGQFIIGLIIVLNLIGFLWIRKIIAIDI